MQYAIHGELAQHAVLAFERDETCCYAEKSTVYSRDPQGLLWEFYKLRGDSETFGTPAPEDKPAGACATAEPEPDTSATACCGATSA